MTSIKETLEVLSFGLAVAKTLKADLADGKMSYLEMLGLLRLVGPAQDALAGIQFVPAELADLTSEESAQLTDFVRAALEQSLTDEAALVIAEQILSGVQSLISAMAMLRGINSANP